SSEPVKDSPSPLPSWRFMPSPYTLTASPAIPRPRGASCPARRAFAASPALRIGKAEAG
ncbi:hypothetical protein L7F22_040678, partial [Adiantum nelumboides]|nr:hypothetical protein [Adiantum nelumboides]